MNTRNDNSLRKSDVYVNLYTNFSNSKSSNGTNVSSFHKLYTNSDSDETKPEKEVYTYEGAIQDYRSRIKSKINVSESIFSKKEFAKPKDTVPVVPKGQIFKRKEIFELEKPLEIHHFESSSAKRLSEDFANSQSIKERLQNFEKCAEQQKTSANTRAQADRKNNNFSATETNTNLDNKSNCAMHEHASSPETEHYMNKLNAFNNDLDSLMYGKPSHSSRNNELDDVGSNYNYSCSDREDSGIHTADVSCSVSQADEPIEYSDLSANTIPSCIEKLSIEKVKVEDVEDASLESRHTPEGSRDSDLGDMQNDFTKEYLTKETQNFLDDARLDATQNLVLTDQEKKTEKPPLSEKPTIVTKVDNVVNYENVEIKPFPLDFDIYANPDFLVAPPKVIEPPKAKPPPPPPPESEEVMPKPESNLKRLNSTKRIKKEMHLKRSSFLGLGEPYEDQFDPELNLDKPPDINSFLQKESKLEKSLYKKMQENLECGLSKVESQDSGLDVERGRLSSDTWCSSIGDSSTVSHGRQDSEQTNHSITSEEEEIMKKEREIIEMVEKEEKSRDTYFPQHQSYPSCVSDQDSEVLKVEHELLQLEKEQLKHQRENFSFQTRIKSNGHSLENICDSYGADRGNYRKSMPELQLVNKEFCRSMPNVPKADQYRKSMPDIQQAYFKSTADYQKTVPGNNSDALLQHRKSLPELKTEFQKSAFYSPQIVYRQPIIAEKTQRAQRLRELDFPILKHSRSAMSNLNAPPKIVHSDNWLQPRQNVEPKCYNQHWLYQEAELRRLSDQQARNRSRQEKPLPDSVIKSLTQRVQNKARWVVKLFCLCIFCNSSIVFRVENGVGKEFAMQQHSYVKPKVQHLDHALPMSFRSPLSSEETQDRMLSVSGKKKCSYCGNELGKYRAPIFVDQFRRSRTMFQVEGQP